MRTLSFGLLAILALAACGRHGPGSSARPAPVAAPVVAPEAAAEPVLPTAWIAETLATKYGLRDVRVVPTRIWTKGEDVAVAWVLSAVHAATGRPVGVAGASVQDRSYVDGGTIRAQIGETTRKVRPAPALPMTPERFVATGAPSETANLATFTMMSNALAVRHEATFLGYLADDVEHDDLTEPETSRGKAEVRRFFAGLPRDAVFEVRASWAVGEFVVAETTQRGTEALSIYRFEDGKVRQGWTYADAQRSSIAAPARGVPNQ